MIAIITKNNNAVKYHENGLTRVMVHDEELKIYGINL